LLFEATLNADQHEAGFVKKLTTLICLAVLCSMQFGIMQPAQAETIVQKIFRAGKPPVQGGKFRSNRSPIPREIVRYDESVDAGTIIIETSERRLYYTLGNGKAVKYAVGVGREGFEWAGANRISRKAEWPGWTPPAIMRERVKRETGRILPAYQPGGPNNPLGARAMYIGGSIFRIHGTNEPWTIGKAMSSGCIRMANDDVSDLYEQVGVGTKVIVRQ
jgi:lipoprotein-anchoring transpeptidase ErfK/SrfK